MKLHYIPTNIAFMIMMITIIASSNNTNQLSYSHQSNTADDSLTFEDPLSGVQFKYTAEWVKEDSSLFGADAKCTSLPCVRLPEISVTTSPIAYEGFSLENYTKQQSLYHEDSEGYKPITLNKTKISEKDAFQYIYSTTSPFLTENDEIISHEIYTTEGINLYKISFTGFLDEQYDKYLNSFKKIINTFTITR